MVVSACSEAALSVFPFVCPTDVNSKRIRENHLTLSGLTRTVALKIEGAPFDSWSARLLSELFVIFPQTFYTNSRIKSSIMPRNRSLCIRFPSLFTTVWRYCFKLFTASWINNRQTRTICCVFLFHFFRRLAWTNGHFPTCAISDLTQFEVKQFQSYAIYKKLKLCTIVTILKAHQIFS